MMKKSLTLFLIVLLSFSAVLAQDDADLDDSVDVVDSLGEDEVIDGDPGVLPDSPFWGLERALERINLALTFNSERKAEKGLNIARERILEARAMVDKDDIDSADKAREARSRVLVRIRKNIDNIEDDDPEEELRTTLRFEARLKEQEDDINELETRIKVKIRGELTDEQRTRLDELISSFRDQNGRLEIEIENKRGRTKIKIKARREISDDELEDLEDEIKFEEEVRDKGRGEEASAIAHLRAANRRIERVKNAIGEDANEDAKKALRKASAVLDEGKEKLKEGEFKDAKELAFKAARLANRALVLSKVGDNDEARKRAIASIDRIDSVTDRRLARLRDKPVDGIVEDEDDKSDEGDEEANDTEEVVEVSCEDKCETSLLSCKDNCQFVAEDACAFKDKSSCMTECGDHVSAFGCDVSCGLSVDDEVLCVKDFRDRCENKCQDRSLDCKIACNRG